MNRRKPLTVTSFLALSDEEKEAVYQDCEKIDPNSPGEPLTAAQRRQWKQIKRSLGRPRQGQGHKVISLSMEKGLLKRADAFAKKTGTTRAALIAKALESVLPTNRRNRAA
jgi:hypothetical protein